MNIEWENKEAIEIILLVEKRIKENGFVCAFPCTICINEVAAHFTIFDEKNILKEKRFS